MMKLLIIGKNGQVGQSLIQVVEQAGLQYIAVGRNELDITDQKAVESFFDHSNDFDFVINAAAYTNVDLAEKEVSLADAGNHLAVSYLAEAANKWQIPLFHISTDYVFDGQKEIGYTEEDAEAPVNQYGQSKLDGEKVIKKIWEQHIILRVSWVFSPYGKNFVKTILRLSSEKEELSIVANQFGSPTSAESIAEVIIRVCEVIHHSSDKTQYWGTYHYSDFPVSNWHQLAAYCVKTAKKNGWDVKTKAVNPISADSFPTTAKRPAYSILNTEKIKNKFGIEQALWTEKVSKVIKQVERNA